MNNGNCKTGERSDREAAKGGDSTASLRKTAAGLIVTIIRRVNVFNEVSPSEASIAAANGIAGVIKQYKLVISSHAGKEEGRAGAGANAGDHDICDLTLKAA